MPLLIAFGFFGVVPEVVAVPWMDAGEGYVATNGQITGILSQMKETMKQDLADLTAKEKAAKVSFEETVVAKYKVFQANSEAIEATASWTRRGPCGCNCGLDCHCCHCRPGVPMADAAVEPAGSGAPGSFEGLEYLQVHWLPSLECSAFAWAWRAPVLRRCFVCTVPAICRV